MENCRFITEKELIHLLLENSCEDMDFVAWCQSQWQLDGVRAYMEKLRESINHPISGILLIMAHPIQGYVLKPEQISFFPEDHIQIYYFQPDKDEKGSLCSPEEEQNTTEMRRKDFHILYPVFFRSDFALKIQKISGRKCYLVALDEGFACYKGVLFWAGVTYTQTHSLIKAADYYFYRIKNEAIRKIHHIEAVKFFILKKKSGTLIPNPNVLPYYQKKYQTTLYTPEPLTNKPWAIFFSQPFIFLEDSQTDQILQHLSSIEKLLNQNGIDFFIKPHPRDLENGNVYQANGFTLINEPKLSGEEFIRRQPLKPVSVFGISSTTLLSCSLFFDLPTISLAKIMYPFFHSQVYRSQIRDFEKWTQNIVHIIPSEEEIIRFLK